MIYSSILSSGSTYTIYYHSTPSLLYLLLHYDNKFPLHQLWEPLCAFRCHKNDANRVCGRRVVLKCTQMAASSVSHSAEVSPLDNRASESFEHGEKTYRRTVILPLGMTCPDEP